MINELSIIIPTYNEEYYLPKLLKSIADQKFPDKLEVIVVDGQSEDKTLEVAKSFESNLKDLKIIETKRGIGHQRNEGATHAKYKYLLFLDADDILPKNFLVKILKKANPNEQFIISTFIWPASKNILDYLVVGLVYPITFIMKQFTPLVSGACALTTKENHNNINGFNENALFGEDNDYGVRSVKNGAHYHGFFSLYIFSSTRRMRNQGRIEMFIVWMKMYLYAKKNGVITKDSNFKYPFGHYKNETE